MLIYLSLKKRLKNKLKDKFMNMIQTEKLETLKLSEHKLICIKIGEICNT